MINIIIIILVILIITCKKNVEHFDGGQAMFVNIDKKKLYNNRKLREDWQKEYPIPNNKLKYKTCNDYNYYKLFNESEKTLDDNRIEFGDSIKNREKVMKSFEIPCNQFKEKKKFKKNNYKKKNLIINDIDYRDAEKYYQQNYGYNIMPLNTDEWFLPSNYTDFSKYSGPTLDKKIIKKAIPPKDKYRTRAFNWYFGKL